MLFHRQRFASSKPDRVHRTSEGLLGPTIEELRRMSSIDVRPIERVDRRSGTADLFDGPLDSDDEQYNDWWLRTQVRQR